MRTTIVYDSVFGNTADIARAKSEIFEGLSADGVAIINADDAQQEIFTAAAGQHRQLRFGLSAAANVSARDIVATATGSCFTLVCPQGEQAIELPAAGEHNVRNALAAAAVALALDVPLAAIAAGLAAFAGVKGRLQLKPAACGATVIDDSYNANPDSMKAGIDVLAAYPAPRIFVMGQIGELGDTAPALHAEVGAHARERIGVHHVDRRQRAAKDLGQLHALVDRQHRAVGAVHGNQDVLEHAFSPLCLAALRNRGRPGR